MSSELAYPDLVARGAIASQEAVGAALIRRSERPVGMAGDKGAAGTGRDRERLGATGDTKLADPQAGTGGLVTRDVAVNAADHGAAKRTTSGSNDVGAPSVIGSCGACIISGSGSKLTDPEHVAGAVEASKKGVVAAGAGAAQVAGGETRNEDAARTIRAG